MASFTFRLADVGEGLAEAEIAAIHVAPGDRIAEDQLLFDVVTDKATVELTSPVAGVVASLAVKLGDMAPIGSPLAVIETDAPESTAAPAAAPKPPTPPVLPPPAPAAAPASGKALASPAVRARAQALGVDLAQVAGSGPEGRVTHADLDRGLKPHRSAFEAPPAGEAEAVKLVGVRRGIAERMEAAWRIPHMGYVEEIDLTALMALRDRLNGEGTGRPRLTLLPFLLVALARVLPQHPQINARYDDQAGVLHRYRAVHVGVATDTPHGLLVPVVRDVGDRDLWDCAAEIARLAAAARERKLSRGELSGSTITVTSLGRLGGEVLSPIVNWPEVAILGPGRARLRPVMDGDKVVGRTLMNLSTAFDHRVVDGQEAAEFVSKIKALLEEPEGLAR